MKPWHACRIWITLGVLTACLPLMMGQGCPGDPPPVTPDPDPDPTPDPGPDDDPPPPPEATACGLNGRDCDVVNGAQPNDIAYGDVDGDGDLDVAIVLFGTDAVSILSNDGDGIFTPLVVLPAGDSPSSGQFADFDGDGDLDFGVTTASVIFGLGVSILANDGQGNFSNLTSLPAGTVVEDFEAVDVDNDSDLDVLAVSRLGNSMVLFLNNGDGSFEVGQAFATGQTPKSPAVADLNGDTFVDVAVPNQEAGTVTILMNLGGTSFSVTASYEVGSMPAAVGAGDWDGDGAIDLAVTLPGTFESADTENVLLLMNDGSGAFSAGAMLPVGVNPGDIAVGDLTGNGAPDIAVANGGVSDATASMGVLLNVGGGVFLEVINLATEGSPSAIALGDLNGDGDLDLGTSNLTTDTITLLENDGLDTFLP